MLTCGRFFRGGNSPLDLTKMITERILLCVDKFYCSTKTKQLYAFCFCVNICLDRSCEDWRITIYSKMIIKIAWFGAWIDSISIFDFVWRENAEFMFSSCTNKLLSINFNTNRNDVLHGERTTDMENIFCLLIKITEKKCFWFIVVANDLAIKSCI